MSTKSQTQALVQSEIRKAQDIFVSTKFIAMIEVTGETVDGKSYRHSLILDHSDPEFKAMLNYWGARKSAELLNVNLQKEAEALREDAAERAYFKSRPELNP